MNVKREWCGINYATLYKSYQDTWKTMHGLHSVTDPKVDNSFMLKIAKDSDWLAQVEQYLQLSHQIANTIMTGRANCLIYCPRGNQSTPVLTSLAQIFLDPFYRTFKGLRTLVHKEWNYYCHNFLGKNQAFESKPSQ